MTIKPGNGASRGLLLPMTNYSGLTVVLGHLDPEKWPGTCQKTAFSKETEGHDDHQTGNGAR